MKKLTIAVAFLLTFSLALTGCGKDSGETIGEAGTYSGSYEELVITADGTVVEDSTATKVIIDEKVGDGDVTLKNMDIETLEVYGGGANSIHLEGTTVDNVLSNKADGQVRIVVEEASAVGTMESENTIIEVKEGTEVNDITVKENTEIVVEKDAKAKAITLADETATAKLEGEVEKVTVVAPKAEVVVAQTAKVEDIKVEKKAVDAKIVVEGQVEKIDTAAKVAVSGEGTVKVIETTKEELVKTEGTSNVVQKAEVVVKGETTSTTNTSSSNNTTTTTRPAHTHSYTVLQSETAATCTTAGNKVFKCSGCSNTTTQTVSALGHVSNAGVVTKKANCTENGTKTYSCTKCNTVLKTETITKLRHKENAGEVTTTPTCTAEGVKTFKCETCLAVTRTEVIKANGHTVNASGECSVCSQNFVNGNPVDLKLVAHDKYTGLYKNATDTEDTAVYIADKASMFKFAEIVNGKLADFKNMTIKLAGDINLNNENWKPISNTFVSGDNTKTKNMIFDGEGHTISNAKVINNNAYVNGFFGTLSGRETIKNVVFDNILIARNENKSASGNQYGIVVGIVYGTITFDDVTVQNSEVCAYGKVGGILGQSADPAGEIMMKNCIVKNSTVKGAYNCAGLIGLAMNNVVLDNCEVENVNWVKALTEDKYVSVDTTLKNDTNIIVKGIYWDYGQNYLLSGWADYYTDNKYSDAELTNGYYLNEGLCHNK